MSKYFDIFKMNCFNISFWNNALESTFRFKTSFQINILFKKMHFKTMFKTFCWTQMKLFLFFVQQDKATTTISSGLKLTKFMYLFYFIVLVQPPNSKINIFTHLYQNLQSQTQFETKNSL